MKKIILFCVLTLVLLIIIGCKAAEEAAPEEPIAVEEPVTEEVIAETAAEVAAPTETLSELKCIDNKIEALLTNTQDSSVEIAKDLKVMVNGLLVVDPECDSMTLASGESTFCSDLSGHLAIREGKTNTIKINLLRESIVDYVECFVEE